MKEIKSQTDFFVDREVKFNNTKRRVVIAGHVAHKRMLNVGVAIFNPSDEYSEELGKTIALGRAKKTGKNIRFSTNTPISSRRQVLSLMDSAIIQMQDNIREYAPFALRKRRRVVEEKKE